MSSYLVFKDTQKLSKQEKTWVEIFQEGLGVEVDNYFGCHTLMTAARVLGDPELPIDGYFYGQYMMFDKVDHVRVFDPKGKGVGNYPNSIGGSFTNTAAVPNEPGSIMIDGGIVIQPNACHGWLGDPESILYKLKDGTVGMTRTTSTYAMDQSLLNKIDWAIGGLGLIKDGKSSYYDPELEGFKGKYAGPLRKTDHDVFFVDKWGWFGCINVEDLDAEEVIELLENVFAVYAVMGDGGSWDAVNGKNKKKDIWKPQWYVVQLTGGKNVQTIRFKESSYASNDKHA